MTEEQARITEAWRAGEPAPLSDLVKPAPAAQGAGPATGEYVAEPEQEIDQALPTGNLLAGEPAPLSDLAESAPTARGSGAKLR